MVAVSLHARVPTRRRYTAAPLSAPAANRARPRVARADLAVDQGREAAGRLHRQEAFLERLPHALRRRRTPVPRRVSQGAYAGSRGRRVSTPDISFSPRHRTM